MINFRKPRFSLCRIERRPFYQKMSDGSGQGRGMQFISLGGDCQVAHHIRRLDPEADKHVFDFLITPAKSIISLIERDFSRFLSIDDLEPRYPEDQDLQFIDKFNGIDVLHDFKTFQKDDVEETREKFLYLAKKFMRTLRSKAPICFVRRWHHIDGPESEYTAR